MKTNIPFLEALRTELLDRAAPSPDQAGENRSRPRRRLRGPATALASFVLVLIAGAVFWALRPDGTDTLVDVAGGGPELIEWDIKVILPAPTDTDALVAEIEAITGVIETQYLPDASVLDTATPQPIVESDVVTTTRAPNADAPPTTVGERSVTAALFIRLSGDAMPEVVATQLNSRDDLHETSYSPEIAERRAEEFFATAAQDATVLSEDPLVLRPSRGPEPQFDTSTLGREIVLQPASSTAELQELLETAGIVERMGSREDRFLYDETRPVLDIGYVAETDSRFVIYGTRENGFCDLTIESNGSSIGCGDFTRTLYGVKGAGGTVGEIGNARVTVPEGTAAVTFSADGGEQLWQRPVAGWALFPAPIHDFVTYVVDAYDATGSRLGHWETTY